MSPSSAPSFPEAGGRSSPAARARRFRPMKSVKSTGAYNEPQLTCYALRYPDLLAGYCHGTPGNCDYAGLLAHWQDYGLAG